MNWMRRLLGLLKNVKLTAVVIAVLVSLYFLGLVIPQKSLFSSEKDYMNWVDRNYLNRAVDFIGFTDIYLAPVTLVFLCIFFLNLLTVMINRIPLIRRRMYLGNAVPAVAKKDITEKGNTIAVPGGMDAAAAVHALKSFFIKSRWHVIEDTRQQVYVAINNRFSPIGFLFFHFSFVLCLIGGMLLSYTRFSGNISLTEGQAFESDIRQFRIIKKEPKVLKALPDLSLLIDRIRPLYEKGVTAEVLVEMSVKYGNITRKEMMRVNEPIVRGATSIIVQNTGVSPLFVIRGQSGEIIDQVFVSLNVLRGEEDSFVLEHDKRFRCFVRFFPDYVNDNGVEATKSMELRNPALHLRIEREGARVYEGTIMRGATANMGPYTIGFEDIRYWADLLIVREYGEQVLIAGFLFAAIGLIMRLVFYQKQVRLALERNADNAVVLYIDGKSEYFQHLYHDELETMTRKIENYLKGVL